MTEGNIGGQLVRFSIPLIFSALLQQLYSWTDALLVGNFVGEASLAAIGATNVLYGMFLAILQGFAVGVSILVSQAYGQGDTGSVRRSASTFVLVVLGVSLALVAIGIGAVRPLLRLLSTPEEILPEATQYLTVLYLGLPAMAVYNILNAILRGMGDSRTPLLAIVISSLSNIALDLLFIAGFGWGIAGAAWATILAQVLMTAFLLAYVPRRHPMLRRAERERLIDRMVLRRGVSLGLPTALQSSVHSVGGLLLQNVMNSFGAQVVAAITTAYRIDSMGLLPTINIGSGIATFVGQNKGAGQMDRARRGLRVGSGIMLATSLLTTALFVLLGASLMRLFGVSEGAVRIGRDFLYFCAVFYPIFGLQQAFVGYLQGIGDVRFVAFASISGLAVRVAISYAFAGAFGHQVIAYSEMASWVYGFFVCMGRYLWVRRRPAGNGAAARL